MCLQKFLRRRKYRLHAAFQNATMISAVDAPVEFEISIGREIRYIMIIIMIMIIYIIIIMIMTDNDNDNIYNNNNDNDNIYNNNNDND